MFGTVKKHKHYHSVFGQHWSSSA